MRFSPGCQCCEIACTWWMGAPDKLYVTYSGGTSCICLTMGTPYELVEGPADYWSFYDGACGPGGAYQLRISITYVVGGNCVHMETTLFGPFPGFSFHNYAFADPEDIVAPSTQSPVYFEFAADTSSAFPICGGTRPSAIVTE